MIKNSNLIKISMCLFLLSSCTPSYSRIYIVNNIKAKIIANDINSINKEITKNGK